MNAALLKEPGYQFWQRLCNNLIYGQLFIYNNLEKARSIGDFIHKSKAPGSLSKEVNS